MSENYKFTPKEQDMLQRLKNHCKDYSAGASSCKDCPLNEVGYNCPGEIEVTQSKRALYAAWELLYGDGSTGKDTVDSLVKAIKDSGERTEFNSGAVRDMHAGKGRYDLLPWCVIERLAKHYEAGALKYSDRNWEKGIPAHSFADSAARHYSKYMQGQRDEDHLIAAIWNLCGLAWTEMNKPEMMDIPARMEAKFEPAESMQYTELDTAFAKSCLKEMLEAESEKAEKEFDQFLKGLGRCSVSPEEEERSEV